MTYRDENNVISELENQIDKLRSTQNSLDDLDEKMAGKNASRDVDILLGTKGESKKFSFKNGGSRLHVYTASADIKQKRYTWYTKISWQIVNRRKESFFIAQLH